MIGHYEKYADILFFSAIAVVAMYVECKFRQGWDGRTYCFQLPAAQAEITLRTERTQELRVSAY